MSVPAAPPSVPPPDFHLRLAAFLQGSDPDCLLWACRLSPEAYQRLCSDLTLVLSEPDSTSEAMDWPEVWDILREYAELAGWDGPTITAAEEEVVTRYAVDIRPQDLRVLERASAAVQDAARAVLGHFLPQHPTAGARLERGRLKKMGDRSIWQIELPDGYRLRYLVAEQERVVYVVYLGPHPDGDAAGREASVLARVQRRRHEARV